MFDLNASFAKSGYLNAKLLDNNHALSSGHRNLLYCVSHDFLTDPPPSEIFGHFQGGGSVQNPDPSGACGGLFKKMNFTFRITVKCINFLQSL